MITRRDLLALPLASLAASTLQPSWLLADETDPTRFFTGDAKPTDIRLGKPRTLDDFATFAVPATKEAWEARRTRLREQVLTATGLWPLPEKTPLQPTVHGKIEREGYTVEKVFFASMVGHYVCGNLYRPSVKTGDSERRPGILFAHGHWANGRFHDAGVKEAEAVVKRGEEANIERARFFMQAIPATLARLGCVVFQYDMVGNADSIKIPHREGFKDAAAELRLQSFMRLQTWNSMRALDFIASLPDVDPKRLGMTGASGGGTQTFVLAAIDDRLAAVFPAVMVSTGMQGGCVCENASYLRVGTVNTELAALFAPKPMGMSAANDWTKALMTKGYPEIQGVYKLYGAEGNVRAKTWLEYGHQYNQHSREYMYNFFNAHFLHRAEEIKELPFKPVPIKDLTVFDAEHPRPKDELNAPMLREVWDKSSDAQMAKLEPKDAASLMEFKRVIGTALRVMAGENGPPEVEIRQGPLEDQVDGWRLNRAVIGRKGQGDTLPGCALFGPKFSKEKMVIWVHPAGKSSLFAAGKLAPAAKQLAEAGYGIIAIDVYGAGELAAPPLPVAKPQYGHQYAGYFYGYNRSLLANRVHDILTVIAFVRSHFQLKTVDLLGWGEAGPWAVLARALAGDGVARTAVDLNQFRFENVKDIADPMMLPGAIKYGGLPAFLAACAPGEVLAHNHKGTASGKLSKAAYAAAGAVDKLTRVDEKMDDAKVVEWLIR